MYGTPWQIEEMLLRIIATHRAGYLPFGQCLQNMHGAQADLRPVILRMQTAGNKFVHGLSKGIEPQLPV